MKTRNSSFFRLSANYTSLYFYLGVMTPFWGIWLRSKGLSPSEIGIIIALPYIMKILIVPLISQAADRRDEYWRPLLIAVVFGTVFSTFYFFGTGFWQLLLITGMVNLFVPAITPLLETITVSQVARHELNYGRIRSFGSTSFVAAAVALGFWAVAVVAEILLFVFCNNLIRKYPVFLIFAVIGFFGTIRWAVLTFTFALPILFVVQLFHALTFGASHLAAIHYLGSKVDPKRAGTAQSLYSSLPLGLGMGMATYFGGVIYESAAGGAYIAMSFFCACAFVLSIIRMISVK
mgnify:CR=1 FL=1